MLDFSAEPQLFGLGCGWFVAVQYAEPAGQQPRVHDAPEGLR